LKIQPDVSKGPIFIVGCPRSGTTLLRNLLRGHPHIGCPNESFFIPLLYESWGDPRDSHEAVALGRRILQIVDFNPPVVLRPESFASDRRFRDMVERVFDNWLDQVHKSRWCDKTPVYVRHLDLLARLFPQARVLHIIRDGRDVALSWLRADLEPHNLYTAASAWSELVTAGRGAGAKLGPSRYLELRYERLVAETETCMREVCAFIEEPFTPDVLVPVSRDPRILRDNVDKWRRHMTASEIALFETLAGACLADLGYPLTGSGRPVSLAEALVWRTHQVVFHYLQLLRKRHQWKMRFAMWRARVRRMLVRLGLASPPLHRD
jgi:hypothetical protein